MAFQGPRGRTELICFQQSDKKKSRISSSRSSLPDKRQKEERTHSLVVGELQPGLILHGALAQVNGCGGAEKRDMEK